MCVSLKQPSTGPVTSIDLYWLAALSAAVLTERSLLYLGLLIALVCVLGMIFTKCMCVCVLPICFGLLTHLWSNLWSVVNLKPDFLQQPVGLLEQLLRWPLADLPAVLLHISEVSRITACFMLNLSLLSFPGLIFVLFPQNAGTQKTGVHLYGSVSVGAFIRLFCNIFTLRRQICADLGFCNAREQ